MAEERNLGVARAADAEETDTTKAELQRRMEEARESITQTVTEIKDTVANQYQAVRDTVTEALDWREQYRKRPVAFSVGALSAGFILGYAVGGTFSGGDSDYSEEDYPSYEESDAYSTTGAEPARLSSSPYAERGLARPTAAAPAATPPVPARSSSSGSSGAGAQSLLASSSPYQSGSYEQGSSAQASSEAAEAEADKPGLLERFKETRAYDKLQEEVSSLGDRFIEELSNVGRTVVLPALFSKVRELFGVDLSNKEGRQVTGGTSGGRTQTGGVGSASTGGAQGTGSSYARSENQSYQTP